MYASVCVWEGSMMVSQDKCSSQTCHILADFHLNHSVAQLIEMKIIQDTIPFTMSLPSESRHYSSCTTLVTFGPHDSFRLKCM